MNSLANKEAKMKTLTCAITLMLLATCGAAQAAETQTYTISIKNGAFEPAKTEVPQGEKVHLIIKNEDDQKAEFESTGLDREERVGAHQQIDVYVGPLNAGTYEFFDDNNPDATGSIVAK